MLIRCRNRLLAGVTGAMMVLGIGAVAAQTGGGGGSDYGLWGSLEFRSSNYSAIHQWVALLDRWEAERREIADCDREIAACALPQIVAWRAMVRRLDGAHPLTQMREVNSFINDIVPYREDSANYGLSDYWASPLEFLRHAGDCEDFAVIKFMTLLELGFDNDDMRIVVVTDTVRNIGHAVLAVDFEGRTYIMDSLFDVVVGQEGLRQYRPEYSVNLTHRWAHLVTRELSDRFFADYEQ